MDDYKTFYLKDLLAMVDASVLAYIESLVGTELMPLEFNNRIRGAVELGKRIKDVLGGGEKDDG